MKWPVKPAAPATPPAPTPAAKKPTKPRERTRGFWPDDDLAELETPSRASSWIPRRKDWLRR